MTLLVVCDQPLITEFEHEDEFCFGMNDDVMEMEDVDMFKFF